MSAARSRGEVPPGHVGDDVHAEHAAGRTGSRQLGDRPAERGGLPGGHPLTPGPGSPWSGRAEFTSYPFRYVWPSELDLMARMAGLRLRERWASRAGEPFTGESRQHVSVWEKPAR